MADILKITDIKCNQTFSSYTLVIKHQPYGNPFYQIQHTRIRYPPISYSPSSIPLSTSP